MKKTNLTEIKDMHKSASIFGEYISKNEYDTELLAKELAKKLGKSDVVVLSGDLGAGKTKFVYGLSKYFGIDKQISSPTFTIVNEYTLIQDYLLTQDISTDIQTIYHFDVYRLKDSTDFIDSVGLEYFDNGLCIIEWGEMIKDILPKKTIYINISRMDENENHRKISITQK